MHYINYKTDVVVAVERELNIKKSSFQDWLHGFPGLFIDTSKHIRFFAF